ncbi:FkbM family methyltransferase [bacterium]|nr:FkbM family methyltransferase [bacterium]
MATLTLHQLRYVKFNSSLIRKILSCFYQEGKVYRIPFGPLRGSKMYYDRSVNYHAILGLWDVEEYQFLGRLLRKGGFLKPGSITADVGANLGFFSMWMSKQFESMEHTVIAFEPAPETLKKLKTNLQENVCPQIRVVEQACSNKIGHMDFYIGNHHHISSILKSWADSGVDGSSQRVTVPTTTLDLYFQEHVGAFPDFVKMDIEGGGVFALKGCEEIFTKKRPLVWIESHLPEEDQAISDVLTRHSYSAFRFSDKKIVAEKGKTHPHPEGVWGTLLLFPNEITHRIKPLLSD